MPVERVTAPAPVPVVVSATAKPKDPKKVAAGRAGAAARKANQECLLAELCTVKHSLGSEAVAEATTPVAADVPSQQQMHAPATHSVRHEVSKADWTPWLLFCGPVAVALYMFVAKQNTPLAKMKVSGAPRQKQPHSEASQPPLAPRPAQHLKVADPFHME